MRPPPPFGGHVSSFFQEGAELFLCLSLTNDSATPPPLPQQKKKNPGSALACIQMNKLITNTVITRIYVGVNNGNYTLIISWWVKSINTVQRNDLKYADFLMTWIWANIVYNKRDNFRSIDSIGIYMSYTITFWTFEQVYRLNSFYNWRAHFQNVWWKLNFFFLQKIRPII